MIVGKEGRERASEKERNIDIKEKYRSVASYMPWGPGIEPTTFWCTGGCAKQLSNTGQGLCKIFMYNNTLLNIILHVHHSIFWILLILIHTASSFLVNRCILLHFVDMPIIKLSSSRLRPPLLYLFMVMGLEIYKPFLSFHVHPSPLPDSPAISANRLLIGEQKAGG